MRVTSEHCNKECTFWQMLLLTASFLTCWLLPTTAQVTIESLPFKVVEGENVLLRVDNLPKNLIGFAWYRGVKNLKFGISLYSLTYSINVEGPTHSGRETLYSNGSLWIQNVTKEDTGYYTFRTISRRGEIISNTSLQLHVYWSAESPSLVLNDPGFGHDRGPPQGELLFSQGPEILRRLFVMVYSGGLKQKEPRGEASLYICQRPYKPTQLIIESVPPSVAEGGSVLLLVHNLPPYLRSLFWYKGVIVFKKVEIARHRRAKNSFEPGPAHSGRETVYRNGSLLLQNVTWKDTGFYTLRTLNRYGDVDLAHVHIQVDSK
ncbi:pregnancy-specific glycoprotein 22-like [Arvicanthis niloticus]|uniref:pregnancy-specific glycoprotein 22-like n=1 Tax=Arvicanthis niloticus TaxID=61156 RepID=UPI00403D1BC8